MTNLSIGMGENQKRDNVNQCLPDQRDIIQKIYPKPVGKCQGIETIQKSE